MYIPDLEYQKILEFVPIICIDLIITHNDKCLMLLRNTEPAKGQYWFPGGRINKMERIADATFFLKNENMKTDLHTINICCYLTSDKIEKLQFNEYHDDYKWINEQSESYHDVVNHIISLMNFKKNI